MHTQARVDSSHERSRQSRTPAPKSESVSSSAFLLPPISVLPFLSLSLIATPPSSPPRSSESDGTIYSHAARRSGLPPPASRDPPSPARPDLIQLHPSPAPTSSHARPTRALPRSRPLSAALHTRGGQGERRTLPQSSGREFQFVIFASFYLPALARPPSARLASSVPERYTTLFLSLFPPRSF